MAPAVLNPDRGRALTVATQDENPFLPPPSSLSPMDEPLDKSLSAPQRREELDASLKKLKLLINALPSTVPEGSLDGKMVKYFTDVEVDEDEGPSFSVDRA